MQIIIIKLIRFYQRFISPLMGPHCRFYPSCSQYAKEAIENHGARRGMWLAVKRLGKCHPWHPGGLDPVPSCTKKTCHSNHAVQSVKLKNVVE